VAIRVIRLFTGDDGQSHFDVGEVEWNKTDALGAISQSEPARTVSFEETAAGSSLDWHNAPHRQYVITLSGRLEFETRAGKRQIVEPGDILLAEDTSGGGHRWRLIDDQPWRRVYVALSNQRSAKNNKLTADR
jgi:quercetin dioxygenase-like cupin family protein